MRVIVIGAGLAGLAAANELARKVDVVLYEAQPHAGGKAASFHINGFTFDTGPHVSFTHDDRIAEMFNRSAGRIHTYTGAPVCHFRGGTIQHPVQCNLIDIEDEALRSECLVDLVRAQQNGHTRHHENFADWCYANLGDRITEVFQRPYIRKYWTVELEQLSTEWIGPRVYAPDIDQVVDGTIGIRGDDFYHASHFRYPAEGGFAAFTKDLRTKLAPMVRTGYRVTEINSKEKTVRFADDTTDTYDVLVSTMPLPQLIESIRDTPEEVRAAAAELAWTSHLLVSIMLDVPDLPIQAPWAYFYEGDIVCSRVHLPHRMSRLNVPPGQCSLQAEIVHSRFRPLHSNVAAQCVEDLLRVGMIPAGSLILNVDVRDVEFANIIYDHNRRAAVARVREFLQAAGVHAAGRYGDWENHWTDGSFLSGERAATNLLKRLLKG
ncbi:MAG TPA: FAD-dependent oxidoreductase [Bryobacteraceae bacterium]|nr:FAD-dependent oxidoreductase [Bryobacteraceae bacterium]